MMPWPFPENNPFPSSGDELEPESEGLRLAALVAQRLCIDWTTQRQQIAITVQNRVVILSGMVADPQTRQVAGELAWDVPGVVDVCNTLRLYRQRPGRK